MILLTLMSLAFADPLTAHEPGITGPFLPGDTIEVYIKSYLLPAPYYDRCLIKSLGEATYQRALTACRTQATTALEDAEKALARAATLELAASAHLDEEAARDAQLQGSLAEQATHIHRLRAQRNTAYAVIGSTGVALTVSLALAFAP